jgi:antirestriction protein ArdC
MKSYQEFCTANAKRLFEVINLHGSLLSWRKNWTGHGVNTLPQGANGYYKGGNILALLFSQLENGFKADRWLTFNQIRKLNGHVLKGSKAEDVYFWTIKDNLEENQNHDIYVEKIKNKAIFKTYKVFNLEQTTLFEKEEVTAQSYQSQQLCNILNLEISHFGNRAFFNVGQDAIVLPHPEQFSTIAAYEATLLHELIHSTGHESRLNRESMSNYGTEKGRAEEELVAEIGAFFLCTFFNVQSDIENHASYVNSWKSLLNEKEIMRATNMATKAFQYLIDYLQPSEAKKVA